MGHSHGGLTTEIYALVETDGRPIWMMLTPGQANDAPAALPLIGKLSDGGTLIADRADDTDAIGDHAAAIPIWKNSK